MENFKLDSRENSELMLSRFNNYQHLLILFSQICFFKQEF